MNRSSQAANQLRIQHFIVYQINLFCFPAHRISPFITSDHLLRENSSGHSTNVTAARCDSVTADFAQVELKMGLCFAENTSDRSAGPVTG